MYDQSKLSELIRFAGVDAGSTVIDVYPGNGDWTRLFSDVVGPKGRVFSFVPAEIADLKPDQVGRMQTLAKEPRRENVQAVSADIVAMPEATQPADVLWLHLFYHDLHTALIQKKGAAAADFNRAVYERLKLRWILRHRRPRRRRRGGHERRSVAASEKSTWRALQRRLRGRADRTAKRCLAMEMQVSRQGNPDEVEGPQRVEPASVREEMEAAGFVLDAESTMLANKDDPHSMKVFDPSIKGETDRFAYRFVKP